MSGHALQTGRVSRLEDEGMDGDDDLNEALRNTFLGDLSFHRFSVKLVGHFLVLWQQV